MACRRPWPEPAVPAPRPRAPCRHRRGNRRRWQRSAGRDCKPSSTSTWSPSAAPVRTRSAMRDALVIDGEHVGIAIAHDHRGGRHHQRVRTAGDDAAFDEGAGFQRARLGQVDVDGAGAGAGIHAGRNRAHLAARPAGRRRREGSQPRRSRRWPVRASGNSGRHSSRPWRISRSSSEPAATTWPGCTRRFEITPSSGARREAKSRRSCTPSRCARVVLSAGFCLHQAGAQFVQRAGADQLALRQALSAAQVDLGQRDAGLGFVAARPGPGAGRCPGCGDRFRAGPGPCARAGRRRRSAR